MRIAIIGPGALGCTLGGYRAGGGRDVVLLAPEVAEAERLTRQGLDVEGVRGSFHVPAAATCDAARVGPVELAIVTTKAYDTVQAMWQHAAVVGPATIVATFQNGLGNVEASGGVVGPAGCSAAPPPSAPTGSPPAACIMREKATPSSASRRAGSPAAPSTWRGC
jgi:2-dehydropantoate 2-reductase